MLTRNSQIGEFYVMSPPQVPPKDGGLYTCDIMIFDEERDAHVRISWNEALKATLVQASEQVQRRARSSRTRQRMLVRHQGRKKPLTDWAKAAAAWGEFNDGKQRTRTARQWTTPHSQDFGIDIRIVVARPFIEHTMHNVDHGRRRPRHRSRWPLKLRRHTQPCPDRPPSNHRRRDALRPRGHAALGQHPSQDHRGPLHGPLQGRRHQAAERAL